MANPEVDRLIAELSAMLEQNRQKRNAADAMMLGVKQGMQQAQQQKQTHSALGSPETGYGGDAAASPYSMKNSPSPSARSLSPSTSREGRVALGRDYAHEQQLLSENPYRMLQENAPAAPAMSPGDAAVLDERKKRFTQNLMLSRGESGGPLGGAGAPAQDPNAGLDPSVVDAVSRSGRPMPNASGPGVASPMPTAQSLPGGWSQEDYDLLANAAQGGGMLR